MLRPRDALILALAVLLAIAGWRLLWFLTDDAYISFRYASNWLLGVGLTWNPPPFQHVEGYSNFSWVALLTLIWWATGLEPPQVANPLALLFGIATLGLTAVWILRVARGSSAVLALGLLLVVANKSFLTWLSSGLETALFTCLAVAWSFAWTVAPPGIAVAALASLLALSRPDGLLFWVATAAALVALRRARPAALLALAIVPVHVLWRRSYYGDWLPNTYYAKVGPAWPEMGLRYLASYVIEYALWLPLAAAVVALLLARRRGLRPSVSIGVLVVAGCIAGQVAYYTLKVGGDHFEYRVFHHTIPLAVVALCALATTCRVPRPHLLAVLGVWLVLQSIIPWSHWALTRKLWTRLETIVMVVPLAKHLPAPLRGVGRVWDALQAELISHAVGMRDQEHRVFHLFQLAMFPPRRDPGPKAGELDVIAVETVGVPGWVYPRAAIIDTLALNDRVLAKSAPAERSDHRMMAHELWASKAYVACYSPNLVPTPAQERFGFFEAPRVRLHPSVQPGAFGRRLVPQPRAVPLTDEQVRACETRAWTPAELYEPEVTGRVAIPAAGSRAAKPRAAPSP